MGQPTLTSKIEIQETIDGIAVDNLSKKSSKKDNNKETSVSKPDRYIWGVYIMLLIVSCIEVFSASSTHVTSENVYKPLLDHAMYLFGGLLLVISFQKIHYKWFKKYATAFLIVTLVMLIYSSFFGENINSAKRAISLLGIISIQPPEIMKLAMVLFLAKVLATNQKPGGVSNKGIIISIGTALFISGIMWINGLTNALILIIVSICVLLISGIQWKKFGYVILVFASIGGIVIVEKYLDNQPTENVATAEKTADRSDTHKSRISDWLSLMNPTDKITNKNRQPMYARFALAHGQVIGQGPGQSRESSRLPLAFSDYIYSIIVEDTGFVGGVALLLLYLCLIGRAGRVATKCRRAFPAFLIMGCAVLIVFQALVHMIIAIGLGPVSGQPLPLISKGGTSIITMSMAIGMMLSVSKFAVTNNNKNQVKAELNALPEDLKADNPTMLPQK